MLDILIALFNAGAKNSTIARYLNDNEFYIPTYGWDTVTNGWYCYYDNTVRGFVKDHVIKVNEIKDDEELDRNWYRHYITASDVAAIKRQYRVS